MSNFLSRLTCKDYHDKCVRDVTARINALRCTLRQMRFVDDLEVRKTVSRVCREQLTCERENLRALRVAFRESCEYHTAYVHSDADEFEDYFTAH